MRRHVGARVLVAGALVAGSVVAVAGPAWAADRTWDGSEGALWSDGDNWVGGVAPVADDTVIFPADRDEDQPVQDIADPLDVDGLTIEDSGYLLQGQSILLDGPLTAEFVDPGLSRIGMDVLVGITTVTVGDGDTLEISGVVSDSNGTGSIDKQGGGTLRLSADNTYTGVTDVSDGTLEVPGGAEVPGDVDVAGGATLDLAGRIGTDATMGSVSVASGGTLVTGSGDIVGDLVLAGGSTFIVNLSGSGHDALDVGGDVDLNGADLDVQVGFQGLTGNQYTLIASSGETTGTFDELPEGAELTLDGRVFTITYEGGTTANDVVLTAEGPPPGQVTRIGGATRVETGVDVSQDSFPVARSAGAVVLARDDAFPDALAGTPLADDVDGPLLINPTTALDAAVLGEIQRVLPEGRTIYVLGGTAAISQDVVLALQAEGYTVERISGATRYDTAVAIARQLGDPATLILATGLDFADALAAGTAAAVANGAVLLTAGTVMPAVTQAYLSARPGAALFAAGGPANTASGGTATPLVGADRYATAVAVALQFFAAPPGVGVASGVDFPDALTGGANAAVQGFPMLLTDPAVLSVPTADYVEDTPSVVAVVIYGGTAAVSAAVATALEALLS